MDDAQRSKEGLPLNSNRPASRASARWPGLLLLSVLLLLFHRTATDMVHIWIRSETFQHAFLVPPITAWLIWRRRAAWMGVPLRPVPWLLLPMAAICFAWLLGELAEVAAASQMAMVMLAVLAVPALYGWALTRELIFPLLFLFFMVPFGEFAVPYLQAWTADITVAALRFTGIPVYREGMQFVIPSGTWSVVEACSGIRYIIACVMVGTLFAYLNYRSIKRRVLFMVAALFVPVLANWIRAYTIVMIGHVTGSPMILGVEHTTYGWFLFGAVVMLMFWLGSYWAEGAPAPSVQASARVKELTRLPGPGAVPLMAVFIAALWAGIHVWALALQPNEGEPVPEVLLPDNFGGWRRVAEHDTLTWSPGFINPSVSVSRGYSDGSQVVQVWIGYFHHQTPARKLVTSMHRLASAEDHAWRSQSTGLRAPGDGLPAFSTHVVSPGPAPDLSVAQDRHRVWHVYWFNGRWLVRPAEIKLRQALTQLLGRADDGAILVLSTPMSEEADAVLDKFARQALPAVANAVQAAGESALGTDH